MTCPLCASSAKPYFRESATGRQYFHCPDCDLRFVDPIFHLPPAEEKARYDQHKNDLDNPEYRNYMQPIADWVASHTDGPSGLDYGCGRAPLLAELLELQQFSMSVYDPHFFGDTDPFEQKYEFCVAVETVEHFYKPDQEFEKLTGLLKSRGGLGIVTALYRDDINFATWYYRLDPTHVCFYSTKTFGWIKTNFGFSNYETDGTKFNWLQR